MGWKVNQESALRQQFTPEIYYAAKITDFSYLPKSFLKLQFFYIHCYNRFFLDAIFSANGEKLSRSKISSTATARIRGSRDITGLEILEQKLFKKILNDFNHLKFRKYDKTDDNFSKLRTSLIMAW